MAVTVVYVRSGELSSSCAVSSRGLLLAATCAVPTPLVSHSDWLFVFRAVRRFGIPHADAEDMVQEVFLVLQRRTHLLETSAGRGLLSGVARRVCSNYRRADARRRRRIALADPAELAASDAHGGAEDELARKRLDERVAHALEQLDRAKHEVLVMTVVDELTAAEIGRRLRVSPNTVSSRLRAAKLLIRAGLE